MREYHDQEHKKREWQKSSPRNMPDELGTHFGLLSHDRGSDGWSCTGKGNDGTPSVKQYEETEERHIATPLSCLCHRIIMKHRKKSEKKNKYCI